VGHPGMLQLVIVQSAEWWLVKLIELTPTLTVPPAQISILSFLLVKILFSRDSCLLINLEFMAQTSSM